MILDAIRVSSYIELLGKAVYTCGSIYSVTCDVRYTTGTWGTCALIRSVVLHPQSTFRVRYSSF